jgi:hypothetical protein
MTTDELAQTLAICAEADLVNLEELRALSLAKMLSGGGEVTFTISATLNGSQAAQECRRSADELLAIVQRAIDHKNGAVVPVTYADFSGL